MLFSIITVSYNTRATIRDCIESVNRQTHHPREHIIIDGCSDDGTLDILDELKDSIAHLEREPDAGIYDAMNKGLRIASGEVIGFLNADDFYPSPNTLETVKQVFNDPSVKTCYGDVLYVDADDTTKAVRRWRAGGFSARNFLWGWMPPHPSFFVRRSVYEQYGNFNLELGSAADYEIMLRFLLKYGISTIYIPQVLVKMRAGGVSNASLVNRLRANRMDRKAWLINDIQPFPWTLYMKPLRKIGQWIFRKQIDPTNKTSL